MKVAVITHDFSGFTGSEIVALEVANYFAKKGNLVVVRAERYSDALRPHLHRKVRISEERIDISNFDLVWSQHGHFCLNTPDLNSLLSWKGKFISVHLSGSTPAETYHHPFASRYASSRVFNCANAMEMLENGKSVIGQSFNMKNSAPKEFQNPPRKHPGPVSRLLVVSNHLPTELNAALDSLMSRGIQVTHLGAAGDFRLLRPADISASDAVISIGKTVQYALCSGRPVYCYDHFGGPGWLSEDNFALAEYRNFSGRCCPEKKSPRLIASELTSHFSQANEFVYSRWGEFIRNYDLEDFLDEVIENATVNNFDTEECLQEIDSMRGALMHVEWIWPDVFSQRLDRKIESRTYSPEARISMLEAKLTHNLANPWQPFKDTVIRQSASLAAKIVAPFSPHRAARLRNSARKRNPYRFLSADQGSGSS